MLASCYECSVKFIEPDATQQKTVERVVRGLKRDLVVQSVSLLSPWAMIERTDARAFLEK